MERSGAKRAAQREKSRSIIEKQSYNSGSKRVVHNYQSEDERADQRKEIREREKVKAASLFADVANGVRKEEENQEGGICGGGG